MLARVLCKLGLHHPVVTLPGVFDHWKRSAQGFCAWCNKPYQWDH